MESRWKHKNWQVLIRLHQNYCNEFNIYTHTHIKYIYMHTYIHTVHKYTHTHSTYSQLSIYTATLERPTSPQARKNSSIIQPTDSTYIYRPLQLTAHQKSNAFQSTLSHLCRLCSATLRQCPSIQKSTHTQLYTYITSPVVPAQWLGVCRTGSG